MGLFKWLRTRFRPKYGSRNTHIARFPEKPEPAKQNISYKDGVLTIEQPGVYLVNQKVWKVHPEEGNGDEWAKHEDRQLS